MASVTKITKTVTLQVGEQFTLPKGATVVLTTGTLSNTCGIELPPISTYKCGKFAIFLDSDVGDLKALDETTTRIMSIKVGSQTYVIDKKIVETGDNPGTLTTTILLNGYILNNTLFEFTAITRAELSDRQLIYIYFKTFDTFFENLELKISDRGTFYYLKPSEEVCGVYPNP